MNELNRTTYDLAAALEHFSARVQFTTGTHELEQLVEQRAKGIETAPFAVIDVRYPGDFAQGHVPGAINLPKTKWTRAGIEKAGLRKDGVNYLYCYTPTCHLAAEAAVELVKLGYRVVEVEGGWSTWAGNGYRIEAGAVASAAA